MKKGRNSGGDAEDGTALWRFVTRSIKAYGGKADNGKTGANSQKQITEKSRARDKAKLQPVSIKMPPSTPPGAPVKAGAGFDRSTATKLKRGQLPLEARLDLHGMTQGEAHVALNKFISRCIAQKKRTVLIITGKGQGVLRRMLPLWLESASWQSHIVAITEAQPKDGGSGAFYIRLRKEKL